MCALFSLHFRFCQCVYAFAFAFAAAFETCHSLCFKWGCRLGVLEACSGPAWRRQQFELLPAWLALCICLSLNGSSRLCACWLTAVEQQPLPSVQTLPCHGPATAGFFAANSEAHFVMAFYMRARVSLIGSQIVGSCHNWLHAPKLWPPPPSSTKGGH